MPNSSDSFAMTTADVTFLPDTGIGFIRTDMLYFAFDY